MYMISAKKKQCKRFLKKDFSFFTVFTTIVNGSNVIALAHKPKSSKVYKSSLPQV